jgi:hypothetical protein
MKPAEPAIVKGAVLAEIWYAAREEPGGQLARVVDVIV